MKHWHLLGFFAVNGKLHFSAVHFSERLAEEVKQRAVLPAACGSKRRLASMGGPVVRFFDYAVSSAGCN